MVMIPGMRSNIPARGPTSSSRVSLLCAPGNLSGWNHQENSQNANIRSQCFNIMISVDCADNQPALADASKTIRYALCGARFAEPAPPGAMSSEGTKDRGFYGRSYRRIQTFGPLFIPFFRAICFRKTVLEEKLVEGRTHHGGYDAHRFGPSPGRSSFRPQSLQYRLSPTPHPVGRDILLWSSRNSILEMARCVRRMFVASVYGLH